MTRITYEEMDRLPDPLAHAAMRYGTRGFLSSHNCSVLVSSNEEGKWHLSIAHADRDPTWEEIKHARYHFVPNEIHMVMALPPKEFYLNFHPHAFHLWQLHEYKLCEIIESM